MRAKRKVVRVIIPTFNCAPYLEETLRSVFAQTYRDYEIVVVDGSTDETPQLLSRYGARLRVFRQPPRGVAAARNVGLREARGTYAAFIDGDDVWEPQLLQTQLGALEAAPEAVLSFTGFRKIGPPREWRGQPQDGQDNAEAARQRRLFRDWIALHRTKTPLVSLGPLYHVMLDGNVIPTSSVVLRRAQALAIGKFDEQFLVVEDYDYWLRLTLRHPVVYVDRPLVAYRMRETGLSGPLATRAQRFLASRIKVLEQHRQQMWVWLSEPERRMVQRRIAALRYRLGVIHLKQGDGTRAAGEISRALRGLSTVGLEFADERSSWPARLWLLLKPYAAWALSGFCMILGARR